MAANNYAPVCRQQRAHPVTQLAFILGTAVLWMSACHAATLTTKNIALSVQQRDITGFNQASQTHNLGQLTGLITSPNPIIDGEFSAAVALPTNLTLNHTDTWRINFSKGEWSGAIQSSYALLSNTAQAGYLSHVSGASVAVNISDNLSVTYFNDNSINQVRADTFLTINLLSAMNAGSYGGVLTINVTFI